MWRCCSPAARANRRRRSSCRSCTTRRRATRFFVEEVFLHLKERGALFDDSGRWRNAVEIADTEVPRTVRLVIERRLERVGGDVRKALTAAAVVGRSGSFALLLDIAGLDEDALLDAVEE